MRWEDEPFVKVYVRDTPEFLSMSWQARCLLHELVRKVDRAGILKVGKLGIQGIAVAVRAPVAEIEEPVRELLGQERLVWHEAQGYFVIPNHIEAQVTPQSDLSRKRKERELARTSLAQGVTTTPVVPGAGHAESREVTSRHEMSLIEENRREEIRRDERDERGEAPALARPTLAPISPEWKLSPDGRGYAETVGVTDIDRVARDFVNHYVSEAKLSADWEALWRRWCDRELRIQRRDRDRSRRAPAQQDSSALPRGWEMPTVVQPLKKAAR